ncbi:MAG: tetratricopeptide repeat protein, partial [Terriglobia bacterium]
FWGELGLLRDQIGDPAGALKAFDEAVRHAPFYSRPRWNRGNVLLRSGQYEAAFKDLNQATQSNPELIPSLIDLAWGVSKGDVELTEELAQIKTDKMRIVFAKSLALHGKAKEAIVQFDKAANASEPMKRELLEQLLAKGAFKQAFYVWKAVQGEAGKEQAGPSIHDGGFEGPLSFGQSGFGWRVPRDLQATSISLDAGQPQSGSQDLRIEFGGNSNPASALVSQTILVEPSTRYKINFASRSEDVVTGGLPILVASEAPAGQKRLGQSPPLAGGVSDWRPYSFEFITTPTTTAVVLSLQRENCTTWPCPIFGAISLDSFSVELLK